MTPTERAKRSDALYYETVSVNRRVLCDMVANRESDLEDAKAENEHMRIKAIAVVGELQEENERLKSENAKLRELVARMAEALGIDCEWADPNWCKSPCVLEFGCWPNDEHAEIRCPAWAAMRELGVEVC